MSNVPTARFAIARLYIPSVTTFLFKRQAAELKNSRVLSIRRYGDAGPGLKGSLMTASFQLESQEFMALNRGPSFKFAQGISLFVNCETQAEVDELWEKLFEGGQQAACGWLTDRFGVSWQIVPAVLFRMLDDKDPARSQRVMRAMLQMKKLDIEKLKQAYEGK
jgi:predicted 3-demethylubiquinone-9 3-methyltransferase (glyoxalase superfamily)